MLLLFETLWPNNVLAIVETLPTAWTPLRWWSPYGSHNHTRDDVFWEAINPSHGFVAIDRQEAAERHWPTAMYLPSDESKGVYLLEAYHLLHCLVRLMCTDFGVSHVLKGCRKLSAQLSGKL